MQKLKPISPFRLNSLLRLQTDPIKALNLFLNPNPTSPKRHNNKPFRYTNLSYDLIISKLGKAKMFQEMETIIDKLIHDTRVTPQEIIFCNVITYYARSRFPGKARKVFDEMIDFRCQRTIKSANTLLKGYLSCRDFDKMEEFWNGIEEFGMKDACSYNIVINACCLRGNLRRALEFYEEMRGRRIEPDVVTFGTLSNGFCGNGEFGKGLAFKRRVEREFKTIKFNAHVYVPLIKGYCKVGELEEAVKLKDEIIRKRIELFPAVYSTLISAYFKVGEKEKVDELLEEMKRIGCEPDTVTYNAMIHGFCQEKNFELAFGALDQMEKEGCKADVISYNLIIGELCRERKVREANELLQDMPRRKCIPDVVSYRKVFEGFCDLMQFEEAASILDQMVLRGYVPRSSSGSKFIDMLVQGQSTKLWTCLISLGERNAIDWCTWRLAISFICKDNHSNTNELFDKIVHTCSPSYNHQSCTQHSSKC